MALNVNAGSRDVYYNNEQIIGVEAAEPELENETTSIALLNGTSVTKTTTRSAQVVLTFAGTAIDEMKKILPSSFIAAGTQIAGQATGTVAGENGVISYGKPACGEVTLKAPLKIVPCDDPDEGTITLFDGVAELTNVSFEDTVLKMEVTVRSEASGVLLTKGAITEPTP